MPPSRKSSSSTTRSKKANSAKAAAKAAAPAKTAEQIAQEEHDALVTSASKLIHAVTYSPVDEVKRLLKEGAPTWYQEESMGWNCLHFAAERGDADIVKACLSSGAVWNAVDFLGRTPGDIALSINDEKSYVMIRNEGIRTEMLHYVLKAAKSVPMEEDDEEAEDMPEQTQKTEIPGESSTTQLTSTGMTLRNEDKTSAGDNLEYLKSKLIWEMGEDGKERVCDADGNGVMMGWEEPLMKEHVRLMCHGHPKMASGEGLNILNIGYGLGIIDDMFQDLSPKPASHTVIEAHPQVLEHIKKRKFNQKPGVKILDGRWQDWCKEDKLEELLKATEESGGGFDIVFIDTFAEGYEELKDFFEVLPGILEGPDSVFSFWNGLGATNPTIYDVASDLAALHLDDVGMKTEWHDVIVDESIAEGTWKGIKRKYWDLRVYKLPVSTMNI
ncbi:Arginine N-methyltransferase 2 [Naganishia albida]|nr:Arginine N-methyltransferase 2 [Naganishia albida]